MDFLRADAAQIRPDDRRQALAAFSLTHRLPLAIGTEAEVYAVDSTTLLKLYAGTSRLAHLQTLQRFYASLDTSAAGLAVPHIEQLSVHGSLVAALETRVPGLPLESLLPHLHGPALARAETLYLDAAFCVQQIALTAAPATYLLFDDHGSSTATQSFSSFYAGFLAQKLTRVGRFFAAASPSFAARAAGLVEAIRTEPPARLSLVHGDLFPGNILVDRELTRVCGLIDFGAFTMYADPLLDLAGAFGFYKMYDLHRTAIRRRLLPQFLKRLTPAERPHFHQFLLAHAILTCNLYAPTPDPRGDGHFQWAAEIVAEDRYWDAALG